MLTLSRVLLIPSIAPRTQFIFRAPTRGSPRSPADCLLIVETHAEKKKMERKENSQRSRRLSLYSDTIDRSHRATFATIGYRKYPLHRCGNVEASTFNILRLTRLREEGGERNDRVNGGNIVAWKKRRREENRDNERVDSSVTWFFRSPSLSLPAHCNEITH